MHKSVSHSIVLYNHNIDNIIYLNYLSSIYRYQMFLNEKPIYEFKPHSTKDTQIYDTLCMLTPNTTQMGYQ